MAKHNCAICGAEVGLMSGQKLAAPEIAIEVTYTDGTLRQQG